MASRELESTGLTKKTVSQLTLGSHRLLQALANGLTTAPLEKLFASSTTIGVLLMVVWAYHP
jgi:hypothetical protein